jgi:hypothetical protein
MGKFFLSDLVGEDSEWRSTQERYTHSLPFASYSYLKYGAGGLPARLPELVKRSKAMQAMRRMKKIDIVARTRRAIVTEERKADRGHPGGYSSAVAFLSVIPEGNLLLVFRLINKGD